VRKCHRAAQIEQAIRSGILGRTKDFAETLGKGVLDRVLAWACLHETEDSFAIARVPPEGLPAGRSSWMSIVVGSL
jgi:hypothetical protein